MFPCSDKAADVIDTLFFALKRERVHFVHGRVRDLMLSDGAVKGVVLEMERSWRQTASYWLPAVVPIR